MIDKQEGEQLPKQLKIVLAHGFGNRELSHKVIEPFIA